jgi:hypothetical protein
MSTALSSTSFPLVIVHLQPILRGIHPSSLYEYVLKIEIPYVVCNLFYFLSQQNVWRIYAYSVPLWCLEYNIDLESGLSVNWQVETLIFSVKIIILTSLLMIVITETPEHESRYITLTITWSAPLLVDYWSPKSSSAHS